MKVDVEPFTGLGTHDDARSIIEEEGLSYPLSYAVDSSPLQKYQVYSMPTSVFFDADGTIVRSNSGVLTEDRLRDVIEELIANA